MLSLPYLWFLEKCQDSGHSSDQQLIQSGLTDLDKSIRVKSIFCVDPLRDIRNWKVPRRSDQVIMNLLQSKIQVLLWQVNPMLPAVLCFQVSPGRLLTLIIILQGLMQILPGVLGK